MLLDMRLPRLCPGPQSGSRKRLPVTLPVARLPVLLKPFTSRLSPHPQRQSWRISAGACPRWRVEPTHPQRGRCPGATSRRIAWSTRPRIPSARPTAHAAGGFGHPMPYARRRNFTLPLHLVFSLSLGSECRPITSVTHFPRLVARGKFQTLPQRSDSPTDERSAIRWLCPDGREMLASAWVIHPSLAQRTAT